MFRVSLALGLMVVAQSSYAFHLEDHERVMREAVTEFTACHPEYANSLNADWLVQGDRDEDLNLINKELFFSHFYHPGKNLPLMWRKDSAARLVNLQPSLLQCRQDRTHLTYDENVNLGHAIHHLQDMAVPAHVVPVMHSFWDEFENYEMSDEIASNWDCGTIDRSAADLETVLNDQALNTLSSVKNFKFSLNRWSDHQDVEMTGTDLWIEGEGDSFGAYGSLGNVFGKAKIETDTEGYDVNPKVFTDFKREQLRAAVRSSLRALSFQMLQAGPAAASL